MQVLRAPCLAGKRPSPGSDRYRFGGLYATLFLLLLTTTPNFFLPLALLAHSPKV